VWRPGIVASPEQDVRDEIDWTPDERDRILRVAGALGTTSRSTAGSVLAATPRPRTSSACPKRRSSKRRI
jgi:hypothetical protein